MATMPIMLKSAVVDDDDVKQTSNDVDYATVAAADKTHRITMLPIMKLTMTICSLLLSESEKWSKTLIKTKVNL